MAYEERRDGGHRAAALQTAVVGSRRIVEGVLPALRTLYVQRAQLDYHLLPLLVEQALARRAYRLFRERCHKCLLQILWEERPAVDDVVVDALHRTVAVVGRVADKHCALAEKFALGFGRQARTAKVACALERLVQIDRDEQAHGLREIVGVAVGCRLALHYLRCHISRLAEYAHVNTVGSHVVVVADEHVARAGVDEEVAVVHILDSTGHACAAP